MIRWRIFWWLFLTVLSLGALQDAPQPAILSRNSVLQQTISGSDEHSYRLTLAAGEYARLTVEQRGIDVAIRVLDPAGEVVAEFDSEASRNGTEPVEIVAPDNNDHNPCISSHALRRIRKIPAHPDGERGAHYETNLHGNSFIDRRDVLQKWFWAMNSAKLHSQGDYAAFSPKVSLTNRTCPTTSPFGSHRTWPFRIICSTS